MKITLLKILFGILAVFIGSAITALVIIPVLNAITTNEIVLNVLHLFITIALAVVVYRKAVKYLLKS